MRTPLIAGNWKMNLDLAGGLKLVADIIAGLKSAPAKAVEVLACPPAVYLQPLAQAAVDSALKLGAQNVYQAPKGAFTGEVSAPMLVDVGAKYVIIGHSERRHTIGHHEDDRMLNLKVRATRAAGLTPILCIGETLEERDANATLDVLIYQVAAGLVNYPVKESADLVIAYEPVWAIGTGRTATPEQAQEAHAHTRKELRRLIGDAADQVRILYGGSMKPDNARELLQQPDVDGGLIGGASLKADSFLAIVQAALEVVG